MAKPRPRLGHRAAVFLMGRKKLIKSDLSQRNDHTNVFESLDFLNQVRAAALKFYSARLIIRRRTPNGGGNVTIPEFQTVVSVHRLLLIGESGSVPRAIKPVTAAIAGKHSAGSIAAMRRRGQTHDQQPRIGIAKPW
jgi:hypothetical protein